MVLNSPKNPKSDAPVFFAPEFEKESLSGVRREEDFDIFFEVHQPSPWRSQTTGPTDSTDISKYQQLSTDINSYQQLSTDINSYQQISTAINR